MKIICTTQELVDLQRTPELESAKETIRRLEGDSTYAWNEHSRLEVIAEDLRRQLAEANLTHPSKPSMKLIAQAFAEVQNGKKIDAIKFLREATGAGLKEAKDMVEGSAEAFWS
jgi:hypothetical protein